MLDLVSKLEKEGEICHIIVAISDPVVVAGVADAQGRACPPLYLSAANYAFSPVILWVADFLQALIKLVKRLMGAVPPRFRGRFLASQKPISHEINVLNKKLFLEDLN